MVGLVVLTAGAIVLVAYREIEHAMLPRQLNQLEVRLDLVAARLEDSVASTRGDVIGFRSAVALDAIVRTSLAGGVDPADGTPLDLWRQRFATRFAAELAAKPLYAQFRVIGVADGGREIVRVDRSGPGGSVRIVPDVELQRQGDRDYFQQTIRLRDGEVYVSPVDLDREGGVPGAPSVPTLRVATPVYAPNGKPFGIVVFNVDLRPSFEKSARSRGRRPRFSSSIRRAIIFSTPIQAENSASIWGNDFGSRTTSPRSPGPSADRTSNPPSSPTAPANVLPSPPRRFRLPAGRSSA